MYTLLSCMFQQICNESEQNHHKHALNRWCLATTYVHLNYNSILKYETFTLES